MDEESKLPARYRHSHTKKCQLIKAVISLRQIFIIANHCFAKGTYGNVFLGEGTGRQWGKGRKFSSPCPLTPKLQPNAKVKYFTSAGKL